MIRYEMYGWQETLWQDLHTRINHPDRDEIEWEILATITPLSEQTPKPATWCNCKLPYCEKRFTE